MQIRTVTITLAASHVAVYNFLADVENLPKWATEFCERIELRRHGWLAYTSRGEMVVELDADDHTGVIDFRIGPSVDRLAPFPLRVFGLSTERTAVSFTFVQPTGLSNELYERQYQSLLVEMRGLIRRFGGGELHAPEDAWRSGVLGLN